jgi:hypothetical protein
MELLCLSHNKAKVEIIKEFRLDLLSEGKYGRIIMH